MSKSPRIRGAAACGHRCEITPASPAKPSTVLDRWAAAPGLGRSSRTFALPVVACAGLSLCVLWGWWAWCALRVEVEGPSMLPTLAAGERLLVARRGALVTRARRGVTSKPVELVAGDLVVVRDPGHTGRLLVKRVQAVGSEGLFLVGDNPVASRDSRSFGAVAAELVVGRPWYRYWPPSAAGALGRPPV
jgi:nickel-type superoxide dismutase maturation protease